MSVSKINLTALKHNFDTIKSIIREKTTKIYCVVKSNAYGCGLKQIASCLQNFGADGFVVADIAEGITLRKCKINLPIVILGFTAPNNLGLLQQFNLIQSVFSMDYFNTIQSVAKTEGCNEKIKIWLKINCGFNRLGLSLDEFCANEKKIFSENNATKIVGIFAHLCDSSAKRSKSKMVTDNQIHQFERLKRLVSKNKHGNDLILSLGNSGFVMGRNALFDAVRVGAALYGIGCVKEIIPIKSVYAKVLQINKLKAGQYVGYGTKYRAKKNCLVAVLNMGYADGLSRSLGQKAKVFIKGEYCKFIGNICMNHSFILLKPNQQIQVGDYAEILGSNISAKSLSKWLKTIDYEVFCRINGTQTIYENKSEVDKICN